MAAAKTKATTAFKRKKHKKGTKSTLPTSIWTAQPLNKEVYKSTK